VTGRRLGTLSCVTSEGRAPARGTAGVSGLIRFIGGLARGAARRAQRSDLTLVAAAMTFYALIGVVPLLVIAVRITAAVVGRGSVLQTSAAVARFLPGSFGVDDGVRALARDAVGLHWWAALALVLPVSLYSEGIVRSLERFSIVPERRSRVLRGRLLTVPLLLVAVLAGVVVTTWARPLLHNPFGTGTGSRLLGIFVAFCIGWAGATAVLSLLYRAFATTAISPAALLIAAAAAGSWLAGQSLGYVLVLRVVSGGDAAYGGSRLIAATAAIAFLVYLNHVVFLLGYALALTLHEDHILS
jgi:membrane protein